MSEAPLVTSAIPLYRSGRFVQSIAENIKAITYSNVEVIISDRHQYDDAAQILSELFKDDPRVVVLMEVDQLTYAQHYNLLLERGMGKYFRWMPHDDLYPRCCLGEMVEIMERHPEYVLVSGPYKTHYISGRPEGTPSPRKSLLNTWSYETSLMFNFSQYEGGSFKGLFRRSVAVDNNIWLFDSKRIIYPERCWLFAMSLKGEFYSYDRFSYTKYMYEGSTSSEWKKRRTAWDVVLSSWYMLRYHWMLDRKPQRLAVFVLALIPLTFRKIILHKITGARRRKFKLFPYPRTKLAIRRWISKL